MPTPRSLARHAALLAALALAALALAAPTLLHAQRTGTVRGTVTTAGGVKMPNVQIGVVGTSLGASSGNDGGYVIPNVPAGNQTLRLRLIGYNPQSAAITVVAGGSVTRDFTITAATTVLDEMVVTGTAGAARRREVGNSIGTLSVSDAPQPQSDIGAMLAGRMAGVQISGGSGNSGAGKAIRLRGSTSVALSNQPLIYIDGVRVRSDEYPKNVPNAGSNLRGPNVNASPLDDISPDEIDRIEVVKGAAAATLYGTDAAAGVIQIFTKRGSQGAPAWQMNVTRGVNQLQPFGTDEARYVFMDPFLRTGQVSAAQLQVSGGTANNVRYFLGSSADVNNGVLPLDLARKYTLRANVDFQPAKTLQMSWGSSFTSNAITNTPAGNNAQGITLNAFRRDRNYFNNANSDTIRQVLSYQLNTWIDRAVVGLTTTWTPLTNYSSRFTFGMDRANVENRNLRPYGFRGQPLGVASDQRWSNRTVSVDWVNNLERAFLANDLRTTLSFGAQYVNSDVSNNSAYSENFPGPGVPTVTSGSIKNAFEDRQTVITGGGFAQALAGFRDRYFVTVGLRIDGNSAFGTNFGLQQYPKISGSWVASDESWWPTRFGTTLKVRAAVGEAGRAPGAFDAVQTWNPVGWGTQPAFRPSNLGNPDLGPERTRERELGFDLSALQDRFTVEFTAYNARTSDALFPVSSPPSLGFLGSQLRNAGIVEKKGIEASVGATWFDRQWLSVNTFFALTTNKSNVVSLGGAPAFQIGNTNSFAWVIEGQPVPAIRGRRILNPNADHVTGAPPDTLGGYVFGPSTPTSIFSAGLNLKTIRGIGISLRGEYQGGAYISENASFQALSRTVLWPTCSRAYAAITAGTPITNYENATCIQANAREDMFIFKANFFKWRDLTISVPLGSAIPGTKSSTFVFTAQNFYRQNWGMPMFDPEQSGNDGFNAVARYISEHIPAPAVYMTSLRITF